MYKILKRFVSLGVCIFFCIGIISDLSYARVHFDGFSKYSTLVDEYHASNKSQFVYIIQDIHCNASAQKSINQIISSLKKQYKSKLNIVGVEGTSGSIDTSLIKDMPTDIRGKIINYFLEHGYLSGAELYDIEHPNSITLYGIENDNLYTKNFRLLYESLKNRRVLNREMYRIESIISRGKELLYPSDVKELEQLEKKLDFDIYIRYLFKKAYELGIAVGMYPELSNYISTIDSNFKNKINYVRILDEKQELEYKIKRELVRTRGDAVKVVYVDYYFKLLKLMLNNGVRTNQMLEWDRVRNVFYYNLDALVSLLSWKNYFQESRDIIEDTENIMHNFYDIANKRNELLVANMLNHMDRGVGVMLVGGFHVDGITDILRAKGISYKVLMPKVRGDLSVSSLNYNKRLIEQEQYLNHENDFQDFNRVTQMRDGNYIVRNSFANSYLALRTAFGNMSLGKELMRQRDNLGELGLNKREWQNLLRYLVSENHDMSIIIKQLDLIEKDDGVGNAVTGLVSILGVGFIKYMLELNSITIPIVASSSMTPSTSSSSIAGTSASASISSQVRLEDTGLLTFIAENIQGIFSVFTMKLYTPSKKINSFEEKFREVFKVVVEFKYVIDPLPNIITYRDSKTGKITVYVTDGMASLLKEEEGKGPAIYQLLLTKLANHEKAELDQGGIAFHNQVLQETQDDSFNKFLAKVDKRIKQILRDKQVDRKEIISTLLGNFLGVLGLLGDIFAGEETESRGYESLDEQNKWSGARILAIVASIVSLGIIGLLIFANRKSLFTKSTKRFVFTLGVGIVLGIIGVLPNVFALAVWMQILGMIITVLTIVLSLYLLVEFFVKKQSMYTYKGLIGTIIGITFGVLGIFGLVTGFIPILSILSTLIGVVLFVALGIVYPVYKIIPRRIMKKMNYVVQNDKVIFVIDTIIVFFSLGVISISIMSIFVPLIVFSNILLVTLIVSVLSSIAVVVKWIKLVRGKKLSKGIIAVSNLKKMLMFGVSACAVLGLLCLGYFLSWGLALYLFVMMFLLSISRITSDNKIKNFFRHDKRAKLAFILDMIIASGLILTGIVSLILSMTVLPWVMLSIAVGILLWWIFTFTNNPKDYHEPFFKIGFLPFGFLCWITKVVLYGFWLGDKLKIVKHKTWLSVLLSPVACCLFVFAAIPAIIRWWVSKRSKRRVEDTSDIDRLIEALLNKRDEEVGRILSEEKMRSIKETGTVTMFQTLTKEEWRTQLGSFTPEEIKECLDRSHESSAPSVVEISVGHLFNLDTMKLLFELLGIQVFQNILKSFTELLQKIVSFPKEEDKISDIRAYFFKLANTYILKNVKVEFCKSDIPFILSRRGKLLDQNGNYEEFIYVSTRMERILDIAKEILPKEIHDVLMLDAFDHECGELYFKYNEHTTDPHAETLKRHRSGILRDYFLPLMDELLKEKSYDKDETVAKKIRDKFAIFLDTKHRKIVMRESILRLYELDDTGKCIKGHCISHASRVVSDCDIKITYTSEGRQEEFYLGEQRILTEIYDDKGNMVRVVNGTYIREIVYDEKTGEKLYENMYSLKTGKLELRRVYRRDGSIFEYSYKEDKKGKVFLYSICKTRVGYKTEWLMYYKYNEEDSWTAENKFEDEISGYIVERRADDKCRFVERYINKLTDVVELELHYDEYGRLVEEREYRKSRDLLGRFLFEALGTTDFVQGRRIEYRGTSDDVLRQYRIKRSGSPLVDKDARRRSDEYRESKKDASDVSLDSVPLLSEDRHKKRKQVRSPRPMSVDFSDIMRTQTIVYSYTAKSLLEISKEFQKRFSSSLADLKGFARQYDIKNIIIQDRDVNDSLLWVQDNELYITQSGLEIMKIMKEIVPESRYNFLMNNFIKNALLNRQSLYDLTVVPRLKKLINAKYRREELKTMQVDLDEVCKILGIDSTFLVGKLDKVREILLKLRLNDSTKKEVWNEGIYRYEKHEFLDGMILLYRYSGENPEADYIRVLQSPILNMDYMLDILKKHKLSLILSRLKKILSMSEYIMLISGMYDLDEEKFQEIIDYRGDDISQGIKVWQGFRYAV